jgi:redox-sensitive bicupin YhaK (pirin superfamily)
VNTLIEPFDGVVRVDRVGSLRALGPGARNRFVVPPEPFDEHSPFVLLVEDFLEPSSDFHPHPHRGFETVTFVLDGDMQHGDSVGVSGVAGAGDVVWMTAGRGIVHGGHPVGGRPVHALQLWMALPAALRDSAPGTRQQSLADALVRTTDSAAAKVYGAGSGSLDGSDWSRWPMTLTDVTVQASGRYALDLRPNERSFLYILNGDFALESGVKYSAGTIIWFDAQPAAGSLTLETAGLARAVHYSSPPIGEPIIARGPFVMGSDAELEEAFADMQSGRFG